MHRRRWFIGACVCLVIAAGLIAERFKYHFWPKRFRVVEAGQIYRGGWQTPGMLGRIIERHDIQMVLNVACNPPELDAAGEGRIVRAHGVAWHKILMPGNGLATFEQLDEAADDLANPSNRPIFVHCAAGVHRTNMALAAYRLKHCGWSLADVLVEMERFGFDRGEDHEQAEHLQRYEEHLAERAALVRDAAGPWIR